jgi:hypothetical protein
MDTSNERSVYRWTEALKVKDQKILAIDSHDNVLVLGDKRGHVFPFEEHIMVGQVGQSTFEQLNQGGKRGNDEIK